MRRAHEKTSPLARRRTIRRDGERAEAEFIGRAAQGRVQKFGAPE